MKNLGGRAICMLITNINLCLFASFLAVLLMKMHYYPTIYSDYGFSCFTPPTSSPPPVPSRSNPFCLCLEK